MEKDLAEDVCQFVDALCVLWESRIWRAHPVSYESAMMMMMDDDG